MESARAVCPVLGKMAVDEADLLMEIMAIGQAKMQETKQEQPKVSTVKSKKPEQLKPKEAVSQESDETIEDITLPARQTVVISSLDDGIRDVVETEDHKSSERKEDAPRIDTNRPETTSEVNTIDMSGDLGVQPTVAQSEHELVSDLSGDTFSVRPRVVDVDVSVKEVPVVTEYYEHATAMDKDSTVVTQSPIMTTDEVDQGKTLTTEASSTESGDTSFRQLEFKQEVLEEADVVAEGLDDYSEDAVEPLSSDREEDGEFAQEVAIPTDTFDDSRLGEEGDSQLIDIVELEADFNEPEKFGSWTDELDRQPEDVYDEFVDSLKLLLVDNDSEVVETIPVAEEASFTIEDSFTSDEDVGLQPEVPVIAGLVVERLSELEDDRKEEIASQIQDIVKVISDVEDFKDSDTKTSFGENSSVKDELMEEVAVLFERLDIEHEVEDVRLFASALLRQDFKPVRLDASIQAIDLENIATREAKYRLSQTISVMAEDVERSIERIMGKVVLLYTSKLAA